MALTVSSAPPPTQEAVRYRPSKAMTALFPVPSIWDHVVGDVPLRPGETQPAFVPHNVLENSFNVALVGTAAGVYAAFYQNSADPILHGGATAVLGRSVATVGIFAAVGPTFIIARGLSANIRQKDDWINGGIGGIAMGTLFGLRTGSAWSTFCYAFFLGGGASIWGYTNGIGRYEHVLSGGRNVYEREQDAAKLAGRRIPLDQVSPPPGEGYGIYPGYDRSYTRKGPKTEDGGLYTPGRTPTTTAPPPTSSSSSGGASALSPRRTRAARSSLSKITVQSAPAPPPPPSSSQGHTASIATKAADEEEDDGDKDNTTAADKAHPQGGSDTPEDDETNVEADASLAAVSRPRSSSDAVASAATDTGGAGGLQAVGADATTEATASGVVLPSTPPSRSTQQQQKKPSNSNKQQQQRPSSKPPPSTPVGETPINASAGDSAPSSAARFSHNHDNDDERVIVLSDSEDPSLPAKVQAQTASKPASASTGRKDLSASPIKRQQHETSTTPGGGGHVLRDESTGRDIVELLDESDMEEEEPPKQQDGDGHQHREDEAMEEDGDLDGDLDGEEEEDEEDDGEGLEGEVEGEGEEEEEDEEDEEDEDEEDEESDEEESDEEGSVDIDGEAASRKRKKERQRADEATDSQTMEGIFPSVASAPSAADLASAPARDAGDGPAPMSSATAAGDASVALSALAPDVYQALGGAITSAAIGGTSTVSSSAAPSTTTSTAATNGASGAPTDTSTSATAPTNGTEAAAAAAPVKKQRRKMRTPSPSPPPQLKKPDVTLRLSRPLMGPFPAGKPTIFSLYEAAFEAGVYDERVMELFSARGQKAGGTAPPDVRRPGGASDSGLELATGGAEISREGETEEEKMARLLEEKYGGADAKPRKRRRRQKQDDEYDLSDAFIDDSTANIDAPTHQGVPVREGFYVHEGAITLKEAEAPKKAAAKARLTGPRESSIFRPYATRTGFGVGPNTPAIAAAVGAGSSAVTTGANTPTSVGSNQTVRPMTVREPVSSAATESTPTGAGMGEQPTGVALAGGEVPAKKKQRIAPTLLGAVPEASAMEGVEQQQPGAEAPMGAGPAVPSGWNGPLAASVTAQQSESLPPPDAVVSNATASPGVAAPAPASASQFLPKDKDSGWVPSPELVDALEHLKTEVARHDFSVKAKFPPDLRPVVEQTAKVALETGCYGDGFFDQMPKIFPYNRYTMMKLIKKQIFPYHHDRLVKIRDELIEHFKQEVEATKEDRIRAHEQVVAEWEATQKQHRNGGAAAAGISRPAHLDQQSPSPPASPSGAGGEKPVMITSNQMSEKPPFPKWFFSIEMKTLLWQLVLLTNEMHALANEKLTLEGMESRPGQLGLNKALYVDLTDCFPPGYMTTTNISREVSKCRVKWGEKEKPATGAK